MPRSSHIRIPEHVSSTAVQWLPIRSGETCTIDQGMETFHQFCTTPTVEGSTDTVLETTLRGRQLRGCQVPLAAGYTGLVLQSRDKDPSPMDDLDTTDGPCLRDWVATHRFSAITHWNHDTMPSKVDSTQRALDWLQIAKQVHAPIDMDAVQAKLQSMQAQK